LITCTCISYWRCSWIICTSAPAASTLLPSSWPPHGRPVRGERLARVGVAEQAIQAALKALCPAPAPLDAADLRHRLRAFALRDDRDRAVAPISIAW
jgi:hypothetical protein